MDKVGAKMLDLFRTYWAAMERLEVSLALLCRLLGFQLRVRNAALP